jgi:chaperonin GroEL
LTAKQLLFAQEARAEILKGVNVLANAVRETLGPRGRNVLIDRPVRTPTVTKDGETVASEIELGNQ